MAFSKGNRFPTAFDAVPREVVLRGEVAPDTEYHRRVDRVTGRPVRRPVTMERRAAESKVAGTGAVTRQWCRLWASGCAAAGAVDGAGWSRVGESASGESAAKACGRAGL